MTQRTPGSQQPGEQQRRVGDGAHPLRTSAGGVGKSLRSAVRWCAGCDNEQLLLRAGGGWPEVIGPAREGGVCEGVV